jgi:beta-glucosidase-like glycosyl hydrolase
VELTCPNTVHTMHSRITSPCSTIAAPRSVNYGMTWNQTLIYDLGRIVGRETRALWLLGAKEESVRQIHIGLDTWSPNM